MQEKRGGAIGKEDVGLDVLTSRSFTHNPLFHRKFQLQPTVEAPCQGMYPYKTQLLHF